MILPAMKKMGKHKIHKKIKSAFWQLHPTKVKFCKYLCNPLRTLLSVDGKISEIIEVRLELLHSTVMYCTLKYV